MVADFIDLFSVEWHSQNVVCNIGISWLWRDCEKLYSEITGFTCFRGNKIIKPNYANFQKIRKDRKLDRLRKF